MRLRISVLMVFLSVNQLVAQKFVDVSPAKRANNSIYLELGGPAIAYSLNYDRLINHYTNWKVGGRVGMSILSTTLNNSRLIGEIYALNKNRNHQNRYLEIGLGFLYRTPRLLTENPKTVDEPAFGISPRLGIRWQSDAGGWMTRIGITPVISKQKEESFKFTPWAGVSIGKNF